MNIVNLTKWPLIIPTSRGPFLAEPTARPASPEADTLYVVDDLDDVVDVVWEPVVIALSGQMIVRKPRLVWAF